MYRPGASSFFPIPPKPIDAVIRRQDHHEADVVVVGAGIFGCAAAFALANQGRSVILLERWLHEPDRIVGELLQPDGLASLRALGLGHCLDGIDAVPTHGYSVFYRGDEAFIRYPAVNARGEVTDPWGKRAEERRLDTERAKARGGVWSSDGLRDGEKMTEGRSFHHGRFVMRLREACRGHANISLVQADVTGVIRVDQSPEILGVTAQTTDAETGAKMASDYFFGRLTIAADGYDSRLRKQLLPSLVPRVRSRFYALELLDCQLPRPGHGHVVIGDTITLLYQIGARETRALFDVPHDHPGASPAAGGVRGFIRHTALPSLPPEVQSAVVAALDHEPGRIPRSMPNSWMPAARPTLSGLVILGDAANMRHPLTGGGMTVALNDALLLTELLHPDLVPSLANAAAVRRALNALHWRRKSLTGNVNVLAQALYTLFAADDRLLGALQAGCFDYLRRGVTEGPIGLLSGLLRRPAVLAYHFFTVAFVSIWLHAVLVMSGWGGFGFLKLPLALLDGMLILWRASLVFLPVMYREML